VKSDISTRPLEFQRGRLGVRWHAFNKMRSRTSERQVNNYVIVIPYHARANEKLEERTNAILQSELAISAKIRVKFVELVYRRHSLFCRKRRGQRLMHI